MVSLILADQEGQKDGTYTPSSGEIPATGRGSSLLPFLSILFPCENLFSFSPQGGQCGCIVRKSFFIEKGKFRCGGFWLLSFGGEVLHPSGWGGASLPPEYSDNTDNTAKHPFYRAGRARYRAGRARYRAGRARFSKSPYTSRVFTRLILFSSTDTPHSLICISSLLISRRRFLNVCPDKLSPSHALMSPSRHQPPFGTVLCPRTCLAIAWLIPYLSLAIGAGS